VVGSQILGENPSFRYVVFYVPPKPWIVYGAKALISGDFHLGLFSWSFGRWY